MSSLTNFTIAFVQACEEHPEWRKGQSIFNALWEVDPALALKMQGTDVDPFYENSRNLDAMTWIARQYESGTAS
jgi:hypothetical protein